MNLPRCALVTNFCPFYRVKLFRILVERIGVRFLFFSDASEKNWEALNPRGGGDLPVIPLGVGSAGRAVVLLRLARALWRGPWDVYIQGISGRLVVPLTYGIARLRRKPIVVWTGFWNHPRTPFHRLTFPLVRHIYRHADALVAYGTHVRDYLVSLGVAADKIFIAWNTADNELYNTPVRDAERAALRRELQLTDERVLLFVGRLDEEKGIAVLLEAVRHLRDCPPHVLLIIGRGPLHATLRDECTRHNLSSVRFLNYVPNTELYKYYALADALIVPSVTTLVFKEPWGLIVNEAMNQGCVVIASDAVGAARGGLLEHERSGLVVPERDPAALADALRRVLGDDALRARLSAAARATIQTWTYDRMAQGFCDAVAHVMHHRSTGKHQ
jgi:glycosyltransferase involved in cell wall biosynthesis